MPLLIKCRYIVGDDRLVAASAMRGEQIIEVGAAVRFSVVLVEAFVAEEVVASSAEEMFRVPRVIQSRDALLKKNTRRDEQRNF